MKTTNNITQVKIEIAKAAICAGITLKEAQTWVDWVLSGSSGDSAASPTIEFSDDELADEIWNQIGGVGISWEDFIGHIYYSDDLTLKMSIGCCFLYGVRRNTRKLILSAIQSKEIEAYYQAKHHPKINKISLVKWLERHYRFCGKGILKPWWDSQIKAFNLKTEL